ncbi:sensor histidine kinase [Cellulophaga sp. HaHaR_3_176]|uniref:sensor histidine kinase n=1 Tax=Cellulophaga sp. HaHaR_3_176 TaxID=1942464 RepID=UPI001C200ADE|nr:sensor histidine kinase [Cellulophaga sp. HaHaR_3_176]QWX84948.1 sensor histidine kinase [Cellulophaga sp. HaHaR_3_176]
MEFKRKYLGQITIHLVLWVSFYGLLSYPFIVQQQKLPPDLPIRLLLATIIYYLNFYYLVPKILLKKRTINYIVVSIAIIVVFTLGVDLFAKLFIEIDTSPNLPNWRLRGERHRLPNFRMFFMYIIMFGIPFIISSLLRIYVEWKKNEDLRKIVEKEKINSELQFLKAQLNPHFLFNSLNAIYSLSVKKSNDTSEAIINLAELMRYMLYEADKDIVPLHKELEYIKNYVQLQRLRLSDSENVTLKISGEDRGKGIPPLLFISFIENAFKYGTDFQGKTNVKIIFSIFKDSINFKITNKIGTFRKESTNFGVGLENIKNRLKLLYPDSHDLIVDNNGETYIVKLTLKL